MAYRGNHRKPSTGFRRTIARVVVAGVAVGAPLALGSAFASTASADPNWDAIAACESSGNWSTNTGNGFYGGLQFTLSTWHANGGTGNPANASREEQIRVANNVLKTQGIGAWPVCGKKGGSAAPAAKAPAPAPQAPAAKAPAQAPAPTKAPAQTAPAAPVHSGSNPAGDYTVVAGDSLSKIASTHGVAGGWQALYQKNKQFIGDPNLIMPGQKLATK